MMIPTKRPLVQAIRDFPPGCGIGLPMETVNSNSLESNEFGGNKPSGKLKLWDQTSTNTTNQLPLKRFDNVDTKLFGGNKVSDVSKKPYGKTEPKLITTHEPQPKILKRLNDVDTIEFGGNRLSAVSKPSGNTEFDHKPKLITAHEPPTTILKRFNNIDTKECRGNKLSNVSKPCGNTEFDKEPKVITTHEPPTKILKRFNMVNMNEFGGNKPSAISKRLGSTMFDQKPKVITGYGPEKNVLNKSYLGARTVSKVKFYDPTSEVQKSEDKPVVVSRNELTKRERIQRAMEVFEQEYEPFCQENKKKPKNERIPSARIPSEVAKVVKQKLKWVDPEKIVGPVCGVQIGDKFKYRSQLIMTGLHSQPQSGIDYAKMNGENVAISIVDAHRYSNESGSSDTLVYTGQGGITFFGYNKSPPEDQKLVRGNLAMKNSKDKKTEVRVIKKVQGYGRDVFVYDGLYIVDRYTEEESAEGKIVFKFHLKRVPGQPSLHQMLKW